LRLRRRLVLRRKSVGRLRKKSEKKRPNF